MPTPMSILPARWAPYNLGPTESGSAMAATRFRSLHRRLSPASDPMWFGGACKTRMASRSGESPFRWMVSRASPTAMVNFLRFSHSDTYPVAVLPIALLTVQTTQLCRLQPRRLHSQNRVQRLFSSSCGRWDGRPPSKQRTDRAPPDSPDDQSHVSYSLIHHRGSFRCRLLQ